MTSREIFIVVVLYTVGFLNALAVFAVCLTATLVYAGWQFRTAVRIATVASPAIILACLVLAAFTT